MDTRGAPPPSRTTTPVALRPATEYRVTWRRKGWSRSSRSSRKVFQTERGARLFTERLRAGHGELRPVAAVATEVRRVGPWRPIDLEQAAS